MIMDKINELTQYIQSLSKKEFQQYILGAIAAVALLALGTTYYIYHTSSSLSLEIKKLNTQKNKINQLIAQNSKLEKEEASIRALLDKNPDFTMLSYFETFYTKHNIKPEGNWKPEEGAIIEGSEPGVKYQEIFIRAEFKNQTMEKLVTILNDIYNEQVIYLKNLEINAENSKINFELTLATKQYKKEIGETE